jgi:uncharacterized phiE125 gp8 family phage protein
VRAKVITDVTEEPVTLAEAYLQVGLGVYDTDGRPDDSKLEILISAAREACEQFAGLSFGIKTLEVAIDVFPDDDAAIELPFGPVSAVDSFSYGDGSDGVMDETAGDFILDTFSLPSRVTGIWPNATEETNYVRIRYRTGYAKDEETDGAPPIPKLAKQAILVMIEHLFNGGDAATLPEGVQNLLRPLRVRLGMA